MARRKSTAEPTPRPRPHTVTVITPEHPWARTRACLDWCREHGIDGEATYRIEIDHEAMMATLHKYRRNDRGGFYRDPERPSEPVKCEPVMVPVTRLPG